MVATERVPHVPDRRGAGEREAGVHAGADHGPGAGAGDGRDAGGMQGGGKVMRQPTKHALREQLALAADEIIRLRAVMDGATLATWPLVIDGWSAGKAKRKPWWRRWFA